MKSPRGTALALAFVTSLVLASVACSTGPGGDGDADGADADGGGDADGDSDVDADGDGDGHVDADADADESPPALTWHPEVRLTADDAASVTTYNFQRCIAADLAGRVHAVYHDARLGRDHVYYARSLDGGESWEPAERLSEPGFGGEHASVAVSGETVYVAWHDDVEPDLPSQPRVVLRRSPDGGATWEPLLHVSLSPAGAAHPAVAATGEEVHVTWVDSRSGSAEGSAEVYLRSSRDRGVLWEEAQRVSDEPYESWVPTVEASGDLVLVGWVDYRDANEEEYLRRSTDGGRTFEAAVPMTVDPHDSWAPSIAIQGETVHFFWFDRRDAGLTDSEVEAALDAAMEHMGLVAEAAPPRDPARYYLQDFLERVQRKHALVEAEAPAFEAGGGDMARLGALLETFYEAMQRWDGGWELYLRRSTDRGLGWGPAERFTSAGGPSMRPSVAVLGDEVHVAWFDGRHGGNLEIYHRASLDRGATWGEEVRVTNAPGRSMRVGLAAAASGVHLLWFDERDGNAEIYYRRGTY